MNYLLTNQETERLSFRMLEESDFETWLTFFETPNVDKFLGLNHLPTPLAKCEEWFTRSSERYENNLGGMNVMLEKQTGAFVGQCGLLIQDLDDKTELEIGYSLLPEFWGKGYASEAARKCRDYAFENSYCNHLISIIHKENKASEKVALRNGMLFWKSSLFKKMPVNVYRIDR